MSTISVIITSALTAFCGLTIEKLLARRIKNRLIRFPIAVAIVLALYTAILLSIKYLFLS